MKHFTDVGRFHEKFDLPSVNVKDPGPRDVPRELMDFRLRFLIEELKEIADGMGVELKVVTVRKDEVPKVDIVEVADGLIDLEYVLLGTAHVFGLPWRELWDEVHGANMKKERAVRAEQSLRGSTFDVVKPAGWKKPDVTRILRDFGWKI